VFGLNALMQRILPRMRQRRRGHVFNMSSLGGPVAFAETGYYRAAKFAVEALSESQSHEVAPLGIRVTIVEPGAFRTDRAGRSMVESAIRTARRAPERFHEPPGSGPCVECRMRPIRAWRAPYPVPSADGRRRWTRIPAAAGSSTRSRVRAEHRELTGNGVDDAQIGMPDADDIVVSIEIVVASIVVQIDLLATHDLHRLGVEQSMFNQPYRGQKFHMLLNRYRRDIVNTTKKARFPRASYTQQLPFFACPGGQNPLPGPPCGATTTGGPGTYATHPPSAPTTLAAASSAITPFFTSFSRY